MPREGSVTPCLSAPTADLRSGPEDAESPPQFAQAWGIPGSLIVHLFSIRSIVLTSLLLVLFCQPRPVSFTFALVCWL